MMVTGRLEDDFRKNGDLTHADEYLGRSPNRDYPNTVRVRRLICRVCKLKFRTRQESQDHIRNNHRRRESDKTLEGE